MKPDVIIPESIKPRPTDKEISAAQLFSTHINSTVEFLEADRGYRQKTPDFVANGLLWEIKSPIGNSSSTISASVKSAIKQSSNIIIDARYTKIPDNSIIKSLLKEVTLRRRINKVFLISKTETVIPIYSKR